MNYLAIIGIIGTIVAIVALILFIVRFIGAFLRTRRENAAAQEAYETRFLNITDHYAEDKARLYPRFKAHYDKLYQSLHIPGQVYRVEKCSCVFSLEHVCLGHYAWMGEEALYFFPIWEDIALYLQDPE
ncbi:hypothetical protein LJC63_09650, partial [Ruminococcaceae bacterium OttesenSCG-928-L11]|nr:hypothetical protein [Ruminococcaceae bacterium OttesenSCG-928-L11]